MTFCENTGELKVISLYKRHSKPALNRTNMTGLRNR